VLKPLRKVGRTEFPETLGGSYGFAGERRWLKIVFAMGSSSWCSLYQQAKETIDHLLVTCPFSKEALNEVGCRTGLWNACGGGSTEQAFKIWFINKDTKNIKVIPLNIAWGIRLARNLKLFEGQETLPSNVQSNLTKCISTGRGKKTIKGTKEEVINKAILWAYFDSASPGNPRKGGSRGIMHLSSNHSIAFKVGLGKKLTIILNKWLSNQPYSWLKNMVLHSYKF
jgi:hypothetical protein